MIRSNGSSEKMESLKGGKNVVFYVRVCSFETTRTTQTTPMLASYDQAEDRWFARRAIDAELPVGPLRVQRVG
jgi:hypothetical protein